MKEGAVGDLGFSLDLPARDLALAPPLHVAEDDAPRL
jgi:hypothetical protein